MTLECGKSKVFGAPEEQFQRNDEDRKSKIEQTENIMKTETAENSKRSANQIFQKCT